MTTEARNDRANALSECEEEIHLLEAILNADSVSKRALEKKLNVMEGALVNLKKAHAKYVNKERDDTAVNNATAQFRALVVRFETAVDKGEEKLEDLHSAYTNPAINPDEDQFLRDSAKEAAASFLADMKSVSRKLISCQQPNKNQLDRIQTMAANLRQECEKQVHSHLQPLLDVAVTGAEKLTLIREGKELCRDVFKEHDEILQKIIESTAAPPAVVGAGAGSGSPVNLSLDHRLGGGGSMKGYQNYARQTIPTFSGKYRDYPEWKMEFEEGVFLQFDPSLHVRLLQHHTPKEMDLRNCKTVEEAWAELDGKYGNPVNVTSAILREFMDYKPRGMTDA